MPHPEQYAIWYDTGPLRHRPDRGPEAAQAHERRVISDESYLRELGFSREDMPDDEESQRRLLTQLAESHPQLAHSALQVLGIDMPPPQESVSLQEPSSGGSQPAQPSATEPQRGGPPEPEPQLADWRTRCLDMAVRRALTRAGQHLLKGSRVPRSRWSEIQQLGVHRAHTQIAVEPTQVDTMLRNAYQEFTAAVPDAPCLHRAVDDYVRALLTSGEEHRIEHLHRALRQSGCD